MKIKATLMAAAVLMGMMVATPKSAHADFGTANILANDIISGTAVFGTWHVVVSNPGPGNVWGVTIFADSTFVPSSFAEGVNIAFFGSLANAISATSPLAIVSLSDFTNGTLIGAPAGPWTGGAFPGGGGTNKNFHSNGSPSQYLMPSGSNFWVGSVTVTSSTPIKAVSATMQDSTINWRGSAPVTSVPEASSLALLLPGLAPLGWALRKRRQNRS